MYKSLIKHCSSSFKLFVLALDTDVVEYHATNSNQNITVITLNTLEKHFPELADVKKNRSVVEFYFTLSPFLPIYIFDVFKNVDRLTTLDSDIYFFSDPVPLFKYYAKASILITPHNFPEKIKELEKFGLYNVSFQSFKNDIVARDCLQDWKVKCANWCYDYYDEINSRFADQKYLDDWAMLFKNVQVVELPGAGLAPWNFENYKLGIKAKAFYVSNEPLIFYHFHGLRILNNYFALSNLTTYKAVANPFIKKIYHIYIKQLKSRNNNNDNQIKRIQVQKKPLLKILFESNEFLYFNSFLIRSIKLRPFYLKYVSLLNKIHGRVNRFKNVYR